MDAAIPLKLLCDMALWFAAAAAKRLATLVGGPLLILTASPAENGEG